jgi:hypothetical protein
MQLREVSALLRETVVRLSDELQRRPILKSIEDFRSSVAPLHQTPSRSFGSTQLIGIALKDLNCCEKPPRRNRPLVPGKSRELA